MSLRVIHIQQRRRRATRNRTAKILLYAVTNQRGLHFLTTHRVSQEAAAVILRSPTKQM